MGRLRTTLLFNLSLVTTSVAVGNNLGSCVDVQCPLSPGTQTQAECRIYNQTLNAVGVATYDLVLPNIDAIVANSTDSEPTDNIWSGGSINASLSWTVGVSNFHHLVDEAQPNLRHIDRIYYLSTPPAIDLTSSNLTYAGCALYMTSEDNKSVFYDPAANQRSKHSYCQTLMGYSCHGYIEASIRAFSDNLTDYNDPSASVAASCSNMAAYVQSTLSEGCPNFSSTTTVTGIPLTGPEAQGPLTLEQNSTSNCYPTNLKENELTRSFSYNVTTLVYANETFPALLGETPLWSVFYSLSNGTAGGSLALGLEEPSVQLLCLRPVDENMLSTQLPGLTTSDMETSSRSAAIPKSFGLNSFVMIVALAAALFTGTMYT